MSTWRALRVVVTFGLIAPGVTACRGDDEVTPQKTPAPRAELPETSEGAAKPMAAEGIVRDPERLTEMPRAGATAPADPEPREAISAPDEVARDEVAELEREPEPELPRGTVSIVGEPYPLPEPEAAEEECVCPVEPSATEESIEVLRDWRAETRYRQPEGSATRVAGGPPEGFERPPPTAADDRPAIPGGFERPPVTSTEDLGAP